MKKVATPEPSGFVIFWEEIWRPVARNTDGRGLARDTFRKHVLKGADPLDIIDGARWFVRNLSPREREYVPLSATWLNRETFIDLAPKERAYQANLAAAHEQLEQANIIPIRRAEPKPMSEEERQRREQFVHSVRRQEG